MRIPAIAFGARSTRSASRRADMNRTNFRACCNSALVSPICARSGREWTMRPSPSPSIFRLFVKRCGVIDRRPSPSPARRPRAFSMDGRRKRLRWAGSFLKTIFQRCSCWLRHPAPQRVIGQCSHGGSWRIRSVHKVCVARRWVEPLRSPSHVAIATMGFAPLNPSYELLLLEHRLE